MELQQSKLYGRYIASLGWQVSRQDGVQMFYKKIPFMGGLLKIQRPEILPDIIPFIKKYNVKTVAIEPKIAVKNYQNWCKKIPCRVVQSQYMPTKTIRVDLTPTEETIFSRFSEAKRRAVRKAIKNGVIAEESKNIKELIRIKNKSGGFFGFITTVGIDKFWNIMAPRHATILLAYHNEKIVGGVLLVFWNKTAMYWIAGATGEGKKLFAPTLLVWEALRVSKKRGAREFDFVGVWDERNPNDHHDWKGFTRFKEEFGGKSYYWPIY